MINGDGFCPYKWWEKFPQLNKENSHSSPGGHWSITNGGKNSHSSTKKIPTAPLLQWILPAAPLLSCSLSVKEETSMQMLHKRFMVKSRGGALPPYFNYWQCKHPHRNKINQPATEGNSTERKRKVPKNDVAPKWQFSKRIPFLRMTDQWMYDFPWTILSGFGLICFCIPWPWSRAILASGKAFEGGWNAAD